MKKQKQPQVLNLKPIIKITKKIKLTPGFVTAELHWVGEDEKLVDKTAGICWSLEPKLAERFKKAVEDGKVFHTPTIGKTIVSPYSTYVKSSNYFFPMGKYLNSDLKKIGY